MFIAALNHYNTVLFEDESKIAMHESIEMFKELLESKYFRNTKFILFLNKNDLFRQDLKEKIPLSVCFSKEENGKGEIWNGENYKKKTKF